MRFYILAKTILFSIVFALSGCSENRCSDCCNNDSDCSGTTPFCVAKDCIDVGPLDQRVVLISIKGDVSGKPEYFNYKYFLSMDREGKLLKCTDIDPGSELLKVIYQDSINFGGCDPTQRGTVCQGVVYGAPTEMDSLLYIVAKNNEDRAVAEGCIKVRTHEQTQLYITLE